MSCVDSANQWRHHIKRLLHWDQREVRGQVVGKAKGFLYLREDVVVVKVKPCITVQVR